MKMEDQRTLGEPALVGASPEVFRQLGVLTRLLHDALEQLGVMPQLQWAAEGLPDARSRLNYVVHKTGEAAEKVLNAVDRIKLARASVAADTRRIAAAIAAEPAQGVAAETLLGFLRGVEAANALIDRHLTDIMLAQDHHDLTGQVVAAVVKLASDLEVSLVKLLLQVAPSGRAPGPDAVPLHGPVVCAEGRADVVRNQGEVDELLASLGF
jgi:chemotaxis protein CheZ